MNFFSHALLQMLLTLCGGQNFTENPIKALAFSAGAGTISKNSHYALLLQGLKTSVSTALQFLSALNLRNTGNLPTFVRIM